MMPDSTGLYYLNKQKNYEVFVVFIKKIKYKGTGWFWCNSVVKADIRIVELLVVVLGSVHLLDPG